jgi:ribosomal protein S18 acetylase RimI-like enzyme
MPAYLNQDKNQIEQYLIKYSHVNFYHLGDLDDFFWPHTTWFVNAKGADFSAILLLYAGIEPKAMLAIENNNSEEMKQLIREAIPQLPKSIYCHMSPGYQTLFEEKYKIKDCGKYLKMFWRSPEKIDTIDTSMIFPLTLDNLEEIHTLYERAYPGNWFDERMLETEQYVGLRDSVSNKLIGVAGVHVYSKEYQIAALGNITIDTNYRGNGYSKNLVAGICKKLNQTVKMIGLNVRADNLVAINTYQKCGFEIVAEYGEFMLNGK